MNPQATTPTRITPEILRFCRQLDPAHEPLRVPIRPGPGAVPGRFLADLKSHIARHGGRVQFGWIIRELPGWFLEAEFHGVWASPDGQYADLTPRPGESSLLFLPDSHRTYRGDRLPERYLALSPSPDVQAVVQAAEMHTRLRAEAETQIRREQVQPGAAGRNDPCPCGSGLKYKKCCGRAAAR